MIYDSVVAKCRSCGSAQSFQFPKEGFISEARSAMALRDYLQRTYGVDYAGVAMSELQNRSVGGSWKSFCVPITFSYRPVYTMIIVRLHSRVLYGEQTWPFFFLAFSR